MAKKGTNILITEIDTTNLYSRVLKAFPVLSIALVNTLSDFLGLAPHWAPRITGAKGEMATSKSETHGQGIVPRSLIDGSQPKRINTRKYNISSKVFGDQLPSIFKKSHEEQYFNEY